MYEILTTIMYGACISRRKHYSSFPFKLFTNFHARLCISSIKKQRIWKWENFISIFSRV